MESSRMRRAATDMEWKDLRSLGGQNAAEAGAGWRRTEFLTRALDNNRMASSAVATSDGLGADVRRSKGQVCAFYSDAALHILNVTIPFWSCVGPTHAFPGVPPGPQAEATALAFDEADSVEQRSF